MIHILETSLDYETFRRTKNIPADSDRMVKKFSRSAAGQELSHPELLRPPKVLMKTVNHLLSKVILDKRLKFHAVVEFISDALRSVRQDAVIQGISASNWILLLQPMVRFHSFVSYRLSGSPPAEFDPHLNYNHLNECLKRLLTCYDELSVELCERDEMEAVFLLLNPGHPEPLFRYLSLTKRGKLTNKCFRISVAWLTSNFAKCSREIKMSLTPILACTISRSLPILRRNILKILSVGYSSKNQCYPVSKLIQFLLCNDATEAISYCKFYNIECQQNSSTVRFEKETFDHQKPEMNFSSWALADQELDALSVPDILLGQVHTSSESNNQRQNPQNNAV